MVEAADPDVQVSPEDCKNYKDKKQGKLMPSKEHHWLDLKVGESGATTL